MTNHLSAATQIYKEGNLPNLLYAHKQKYGNARHERPMHGHDSLCEVLLCYRGFGSYNVDQISYPIQTGDIIFYNAGELHEVVSDYDTEIGTFCFGLTGVHLEGLPPNHLIPSGVSHVRATGTLFPLLCGLAEQALANRGGLPIHELTAQLAINTFLLIAQQIPNETHHHRVSRSGNLLTERIKEYIDAHYTEPLTLEDIANVMNCSVPYLSHTFKSMTGYSPIQYAIRRRIGFAQTLLISSDFSATRIATMVGYDNTNYFNALFTKIVGITPIRYRKKYLEELRGERNQS